MLGDHQGVNREWPAPGKTPPIFQAAKQCRRTFTPNESRFWNEARARWRGAHWRRYAPIAILVGGKPSVWYAPFYCANAKLIVCISDRQDFPYRIYGHNHGLYERHGYTVLDFTEDLSCPVDDSVWEDLMHRVSDHLTPSLHRAA